MPTKISIENTENGQILKITDSFPKGSGINTNQDSALVRPFRKLIEDGSTVGSVKYISLRENDVEYFFGSFVYTEGKRILFFPGSLSRFAFEPPGWKNLVDIGNPIIDHFTLDKNLKKMHLKLLGAKKKIPASQTKRIDKFVRFWFQWQLSSLEELEKFPKELETKLKPPRMGGEILRKLPALIQSKDKEISVVTSRDKTQDSFFWAFQFYVVQPNVKTSPKLKRIQINLPRYAIVNDSRNSNNPIDATKILLKGFDGYVVIRSYKIIGIMEIENLFMSGTSLP